MSSNQIIILDENLLCIGTQDKLVVHTLGLLHKGFSIILYDPVNQTILLQKRNKEKYHSGGLWTNSCCSHFTNPLYSTEEICNRIHEELNIQLTRNQIIRIGSYRYHATLSNKLIENEYCDAFYAEYDSKKEILFNTDEIEEISWNTSSFIKENIKKDRSIYSPWFPVVLSLFDQYLEAKNKFK